MIYKDKDRGTWYVQLDRKDKVTGKRIQIKKRGFATKREAKRWLDQYDAEPVPHKLTFEEVSERYLDSLESAPETRKAKQTALKLRFTELYELPIESINRDRLDQWRTQLSQMDYSDRTKTATLRLVRSVLRYYFQIYGLPDTVTVVLKPLKKKEQKKEMSVWSLDEFNKFVECVDGYVYQVFFELLYWTGMRRGEALALQKSDLNGNRINIHASTKHFKNGLKQPKTSSSIRTITIDDYMVQRLEPLLSVPGPFLFGGEQSLSISNLQRRHDSAIKESGVKSIRIHDLRHSHASFLLDNGFNIAYISKRLGHSNINQTLTTYAHLMEKTATEMDEKLNSLHKPFQNPATAKLPS